MTGGGDEPHDIQQPVGVGTQPQVRGARPADGGRDRATLGGGSGGVPGAQLRVAGLHLVHGTGLRVGDGDHADVGQLQFPGVEDFDGEHVVTDGQFAQWPVPAGRVGQEVGDHHREPAPPPYGADIPTVQATMKAGSVCLMHTRAGHSSGPNLGTQPRRLFIAVYSAEDAIPLSPNPLPSKHEGLLVRGEKTGRVRSVPFELKLPQRPSTGSFFNQQVGYDG